MYQHDRAWADSYESQVLTILNQLMPYLAVIGVASEEKDRKQATDFEIQLTGGTIAVRLRRIKTCRWWRDLTIRSRRANGAKTELPKIQAGYAYRYFYGWIDEQGKISEWILVDLDRVRATGLLERPRPEKPNYGLDGKPDGTFFIPITSGELHQNGCLLAYQLGNEFVNQLATSRRVNTQVSLTEGIERAKQIKCYSPRIAKLTEQEMAIIRNLPEYEEAAS